MERDLRALREPEAGNVCCVAAAVIGAGALSAGAAVYGANKQSKAAGKAADVSLDMYNMTRGDLAPYNAGGQAMFADANRLLTGSPAEAQARMEGMPGYQFALSTGLKGVQNSAAARGLGVSGAALKGAATYATGLADQTYGNQVNRLFAGATIGENAGAQTGAAGTAAAQQAGSAYIGAGNAAAGGAAGVASGLGSGLIGYGMYGGFGGGGGGGNGPLPPEFVGLT